MEKYKQNRRQGIIVEMASRVVNENSDNVNFNVNYVNEDGNFNNNNLWNVNSSGNANGNNNSRAVRFVASIN